MPGTRIGLIGLGHMGGAMARRLLERGTNLTVWNRSPRPAEELAGLGARPAGSPAEVGAACEVVVTMLTDDRAVEEVVLGSRGVAEGAGKGTVVADMSTTSSECMERVATALAPRGIEFVDAPVFGSTGPAGSGQLVIVAGGEEASVEAVRPVFDALAKVVFHTGPVGSGSAMKLAGNMIGTGMASLLANALAFGGAAGLDRACMLEVIGSTSLDSPAFQARGRQMLAREFAPGWPLRHALKDIRLVRAAAERLGVPLRVAAGIEDDFTAALAVGAGDQDASAVIRGIEGSGT